MDLDTLKGILSIVGICCVIAILVYAGSAADEKAKAKAQQEEQSSLGPTYTCVRGKSNLREWRLQHGERLRNSWAGRDMARDGEETGAL